MKGRKVIDQPVIDRAYLNNLYTNIHQKIVLLDDLNKQYHSKQQEHFLKSFMNVIQKMGNDLILAQQAYRNIDIEVKRDQYCLELVAELNFFKDQCFYLRDQMAKIQEKIKEIKVGEQDMQIQMLSLKLTLNKKHQENVQLREQIDDLKDRLKKSHFNNNLLRRSMPLNKIEGVNKDLFGQVFATQNQMESHNRRYSVNTPTPEKTITARRFKDSMIEKFMQSTQIQTPNPEQNSSSAKRSAQTHMRSFRKRNNVRNQSSIKEYQP